ncbi:WD domain, G-beta repeat protein [Cooperia oncophora]
MCLETAVFNEATDSVLSIDINGGEIVAGSADGNYRLYSIREGNWYLDFVCFSYTGHKNSEYKVDSCVMASIEEVVSGSEDGFVYIWSLLDSAVIAKLEHPSKVVHSLSTHPKKQHLLTAAGQMVYLWVTKNDEDFEC